jgi:monovalent cation/hydrogen antiporter
MTILEGDSLINDASGLLLYRFAVAAALTGTFHATEGVPALPKSPAAWIVGCSGSAV